MLNADALFEMMECARTLGGDADDGDHDGHGDHGDARGPTDGGAADRAPRCAQSASEPVIVYLPNGNAHVCLGMRCPHLVQSAEVDHAYSCGLSGRLIGTSVEAAHDSSWTGRSCGSADPDMHSGAANGASAWRNKRNAFAASAAAYASASTEPVADVHAYAGKPEAEVKIIKRGAPCIVDVDDAVVAAQKRTKALKRMDSLRSRDVQERLFADASNVVIKLFSVVPPSSRKQRRTEAANAIAPAASTMDDPRLENYNFVLQMGLRRYVARCKHASEPITLSGIHDVAIAANAFAKARQREAATRNDATRTRNVAINGRTLELCAQLIFSLWQVLCSTPYFIEHQTGDSFRPFASGVMYGLKRGIRLPSGLVAVPQLEALSSQLPELRSTTATSAARQLQASSHKGLCSIHRGLASVDTMDKEPQAEALEKLRVVSEVAARLVTFVNDAARNDQG